MPYSDFTTYGGGGYTPAVPGYFSGGGSAAYGSVPAGPPAVSTAPYNVPSAMSAGTSVYSQLPGYGASLGSIGQNIQSETSGQVPQDVIDLLKQQGAESNVTSGRIGSNASFLKALGLTSLGLEDTGLRQFESVLPMLPGASIANNPGQYTNPELAYNAALERNVLGAAPQPAAAARAGLGAAGAGFAAGRGGGNPSLNPTYSFANGIAPPALSMDSSGTGTFTSPGYSDWYSGPKSDPSAVDPLTGLPWSMLSPGNAQDNQIPAYSPGSESYYGGLGDEEDY